LDRACRNCISLLKIEVSWDAKDLGDAVLSGRFSILAIRYLIPYFSCYMPCFFLCVDISDQ
jgi:hypothetical protein